ncbi:cold-shock DNA-binding domain [Brachionus plicatilis]|uniref:Cold-shock DNA-binding domain n=1 Tax=Brachionus plicatilis TaxID=10195 RepID=A0A3M7T7B9_BRAPC|nr:cold-shock DNA-binding domain [Brachionus plicatilis]
MSQECLNMAKNKLLIHDINLDLKKNIFTQCLKNFEIYKSDPKSFIDESYENLKNQLDIRLEEIKLIVDKKIDDYYDDLFRIIGTFCKSIRNSNNFSSNISVELRLLNLFDEEKDFYLIFEKVYDKDHFYWGFNHFIGIDEIMDPNKGFYNFEKNSITLQVMLKIDGTQNSLKPLIEEKVTGIVRWFDEKNGFGFIARNDTNAKIFVRKSDIVNMNTNRKSLKGKKVKFDIIMGAKGLEAVNVTGSNGQSTQGSIHATRYRRRKIKSYCANHEKESEE